MDLLIKKLSHNNSSSMNFHADFDFDLEIFFSKEVQLLYAKRYGAFKRGSIQKLTKQLIFVARKGFLPNSLSKFLLLVYSGKCLHF